MGDTKLQASGFNTEGASMVQSCNLMLRNWCTTSQGGTASTRLTSAGAQGKMQPGKSEIVPAEAQIVVRIFQDYAQGRSSKSIAHTLNRKGIPGPQGKAWGPSTIYGNRARSTGILNNELYTGRLV